MQLAFLARSGQPGAPTVLSTPRWGFEDVVLGPSSTGEKVNVEGRPKKLEIGGPEPRVFGTYVVRNVFYKLMPCEGHALTAVEACVCIRRGMEARDVKWDIEDVARVDVRTHHAAMLIISKPASFKLMNPADRDHCLEFMLAVALLKGAPPEYGDYADDALWASDPRVDLLRERMVVTEDDGFSRAYHDLDVRSLASGVRVQFLDGSRTEEVVVEHPLGSPKRQGTSAAVMEKAIRNLRLNYDDDTVGKVVDMVENGEYTSVCRLFDLLWKGHSSTQKL